MTPAKCSSTHRQRYSTTTMAQIWTEVHNCAIMLTFVRTVLPKNISGPVPTIARLPSTEFRHHSYFFSLLFSLAWPHLVFVG